ncbi:MAG: glycosyltransferase [Muribaculum sp.]
MKVLVLNSILFTAEKGVIPTINSIKDTMIYGMCQGFLKSGHEPVLAVAADYRPIEPETYDFTVLFFESKFKKIFKPAYLPFSTSLNKYIRHHGKDFDIILSSETFALPTLFAAIYSPKNLFVWQELTKHQKKLLSLPSKAWHNYVARLIISKAACVIPRSLSAYNFISGYLDNVTDTIVEHGIDTGVFTISEIKKRQFIVYSQLIARKNVKSIITKFKHLHDIKEYSDIKLIIAGRGNEEDELKSYVAKLNLDNNVLFKGFLPHDILSKYIRESMALLTDTLSDLNMVSIPEAIVCGTPVVTNTIPASSDYISDNNLGIVKDGWDKEELIEIIENNRFYVNNCIKYRPNLSNQAAADKIINLWKKAAGG